MQSPTKADPIDDADKGRVYLIDALRLLLLTKDPSSPPPPCPAVSVSRAVLCLRAAARARAVRRRRRRAEADGLSNTKFDSIDAAPPPTHRAPAR
jgi:hypothetical protein